MINVHRIRSLGNWESNSLPALLLNALFINIYLAWKLIRIYPSNEKYQAPALQMVNSIKESFNRYFAVAQLLFTLCIFRAVQSM